MPLARSLPLPKQHTVLALVYHGDDPFAGRDGEA